MTIKVYLPNGAETLRVAPGADILDAIYEEFGVYAEFDII